MSKEFRDGLVALKNGNFKKAIKLFSNQCKSEDEVIRTAAFNNWIWAELLQEEYFEANTVLLYMKEQGAASNSFTLCLELILEFEILKDKLSNPKEKIKAIIERYYDDKQIMVIKNLKSEKDFQEERGTVLLQAGLLVKAYQVMDQFYEEELSEHEGNLIQYCGALAAYGCGNYSKIDCRLAEMSEPEPFKKALKETFLMLKNEKLPKLELNLEVRHCLGLLDYSLYLNIISQENIHLKPYELLMFLMMYNNTNKDIEDYALKIIVTHIIKSGEFGIALGEVFLQDPQVPMSIKYMALDALIECGIYQINTPVAVNSGENQPKIIMSSYVTFIEDDLITLASVQNIESLIANGDLDEAQRTFSNEVLKTENISKSQIDIGFKLYSLVEDQQMYQLLRQLHEAYLKYEAEFENKFKESNFVINTHQNKLNYGLFQIYYGHYIIKKPVKETEAAYLSLSKVAYLRERLDNWQVNIPKSAKRADLINLLLNAEERPSSFMKALMTLTAEESDCLKGILDKLDGSHEKEDVFRMCLELLRNGLVYAVKHDDGCKIVIPEDLEPLIRSIMDRPDYQIQQHLITKVRRFSIAAVEYYGFIPIRDLHQILEKVDPVLGSQVNEHTFNMYFDWLIPRIDNGVVYLYKGQKILMSSDLLDYEGSVAFDNFSSEILLNPKTYHYPAKEEFYNSRVMLEETPEAIQVVEIIGNMTNDFADYFGLSEILHDLRIEANFMDLENIEKEALIVFEENEYDFSSKYVARKAGEAAERFIKTIPLWRLKGHPILTSKVAIKQSGETAKVGRNDPCPCGSGKKYKKCCGM